MLTNDGVIFVSSVCLVGWLVVYFQLVQVIINTTHLEQSCHFLEEFISNITNVPPDTVNATKLYGTSTFKVNTLFPSFLSFLMLVFYFHTSFSFVIMSLSSFPSLFSSCFLAFFQPFSHSFPLI